MTETAIRAETARPDVAPAPPEPVDPAPVEARDQPSLMRDIGALIEDGKTYLEAELTYQKSRAGFAADRVKWGVVYGAAALGFLHLALIALTVGLVIALAPVTGPWLATAIVVALLLLGALLFVLRLKKKMGDVRSVFEDNAP